MIVLVLCLFVLWLIAAIRCRRLGDVLDEYLQRDDCTHGREDWIPCGNCRWCRAHSLIGDA